MAEWTKLRRAVTALCGAAAILLLSWLLLRLCTNNPYRPGEASSKTLFASFSTAPTKLDPATAYYLHEDDLLAKIYEPPFDYHYLKRPYELVPLTAADIPPPVYFGRDGQRLAAADPAAELVARVEYTVRLKPGTRYQPHPCFARDAQGRLLYHQLSDADAARLKITTPGDFPVQGTRELTAQDYAIGVRRMADPRLSSPVLSALSRYLLGLEELNLTYARQLEEERARRAATGRTDEAENPIRLDYLKAEFPGIQVVDDRTFKVVLSRKYPQIRYWMAMHFFAPIPQEALDFYAQSAMIRRQVVLNRWPVGTGAHYMTYFDPNQKIVLERNPHFREEYFPSAGEPSDAADGFLEAAGRRVPFVDRMVIMLEKEPLPRWNKFMQGYYDYSFIAAEAFNQAVDIGGSTGAGLTPEMRARGITLQMNVLYSIRWFAFNMLDDVVGGYTPQRQKLRQAVSIVLDENEFLPIFLNNRGVPAQSILPPGIFGSRAGAAGVNPYTDVWNPQRNRAERQPLAAARRLLAEAGYPEGRGPDGRPLVIHLDHAMAGLPTFVSMFQWYKQKLASLGIELRDRGTELERFRAKVDAGNFQCMLSGWYSDYPDPENFLFLLYGPNGKVKSQGENYTNYANPEYDRLFEKMEGMENGAERQRLIDGLVEISRHDAPGVWCYHEADYRLLHGWCRSKYSQISRNTLKYTQIDPVKRVRLQQEWNQPRTGTVLAFISLLLVLALPVVFLRGRKER